MTVRIWHLLLPVCLLVALFNWGAALLLWIGVWFVFGSSRRILFIDFGVEYARKDRP